MQSKRDDSDKSVQFHIFAQALVVVILWGAFRYCGRFSKAKTSEKDAGSPATKASVAMLA